MAADAFGRIVAAIDYPMYVVTTRGSTDSRTCGLPGRIRRPGQYRARRFWWHCRDKTTHTGSPGRNASGGSPVAEGCNGTRRAIRGSTEDSIDKFSRCEWTEGGEHAHSGGATAWFVGRIHARWDFGDHF